MSAPPLARRSRRLDWRHLLPNPDGSGRRTAMILGLPGDVADALVDAGVVDSIVARPADGQVDLLVVGPGVKAADLRRAAESLLDGGTLYVERHRTADLPRTLWAARRAARSAGLTEVGRWAALPDLVEPRRFLPLDHRGALRWYFRWNFVASTLAAGAGRVVLLAAVALPRLVEHAVPTTVLVAIRGSRPEPQKIPGVPGLAARHRAVITSGHDLGSRAIVLPFEPRSTWPAVAIKVATRRTLGEATRGEHDRLHDLRQRLPPKVSSALPVPLASFELSGLAAAAQETACGPTLWARSGRWPRRPMMASDDLDLVTGWLIDLAQATSGAGPPDPAEAWLEQPLADLQAMRPVSDGLERLVAEVATELRACAGAGLVSVVQHYDTGPWNLVRSRRGLCVLDWELDREAGRDGFGPPLVDLLYFVGSWHSLASGRTSAEGQVRDLVDLFAGARGVSSNLTPDARYPTTPRDPITRQSSFWRQVRRHPTSSGGGWQTPLAVSALRRYADEVEVPRSSTRALLVALWLERALTSLRRWHRIGDSAAWDETPLRYLEGLAHPFGSR